MLRRSSFRDLDISEEVFDVSHGSAVHLQACTFTNVTVPDNEYVSTSYSDYFYNFDTGSDMYAYYYPDDDAGPLFDIPRWSANATNGLGSRVDTWVADGLMGDCLYWFRSHMPGCPEPESTNLKEEYARRAVQANVRRSRISLTNFLF